MHFTSLCIASVLTNYKIIFPGLFLSNPDICKTQLIEICEFVNENMYITIENGVLVQPLPEISRVPGVILPPTTFSDCLMVLQFLHSFGKMLRLDIDPHMLNPRDLQEGLLNMGENAGRLQDMLVRMLSVAVNDPGMPAGHKVSG